VSDYLRRKWRWQLISVPPPLLPTLPGWWQPLALKCIHSLITVLERKNRLPNIECKPSHAALHEHGVLLPPSPPFSGRPVRMVHTLSCILDKTFSSKKLKIKIKINLPPFRYTGIQQSSHRVMPCHAMPYQTGYSVADSSSVHEPHAAAAPVL